MEILQKNDADILLQILEQRMQQIRDGKCRPADEVLRDVLKKINEAKQEKFPAPVRLRKAS